MNEFNQNLYDALEEQFEELRILEADPRSLFSRSDVLHVHWPEDFLTRKNTAAAVARLTVLMSSAAWFRLRGRKVVWTAHNAQAHESHHPRLASAYKAMFRHLVTDVVHLTSHGARVVDSEWWPGQESPSWTAHTIEHGPYHVVRPEIPRSGGVRLLALGQIRPYKNLVEFAHQWIDSAGAADELVIAGGGDEELISALEAIPDDRIEVIGHHIGAAELQKLLGFADALVVTSKRHNSGLVYLALSAGVPVLVPASEYARGLTDSYGSSWIVEYGEPKGKSLCDAIKSVRVEPLPAESPLKPWASIAGEYMNVYTGSGRRRFLYVSGAPRVSVRPESKTPGPRSHILGIFTSVGRSQYQGQLVVAGECRLARRYLQGDGTESAGSGALGLVRDLVRLVWRVGFALAVRVRTCTQTPDVIYERYGLMQDAAMFFRSSETFDVVECNGLFYREAASDRDNLSLKSLARRLELARYERADLVVAVSETMRAALLEDLPEASEKIVVVPNGVDVGLFDPEEWVDCPIDGPIRMVWTGTLVEWQGVAEFLQFLARRRDQLPEFTVDIIGDGPDLARCKEIASNLLEDGQCVFHGRLSQNEVVSVLRTSHIAYCGHLRLRDSAMYHSPLKLYEYLAMGIPTVTTLSRDAAKIYGDLSIGDLIFEPDIDNSLLSSIEFAIGISKDRSWRKRIREEVVQCHSWDARFRSIEREICARSAKKVSSNE
ncbi:glycosyltransferase [Gordonia amicalis]|uniref:Glycosyltransferase n=1 Tax=Gordonia amicalis TaxID=89053 RepID=A0ABU4DJQ4_9ACTN|nr:glycosyltransferase [Gordonia amicalis]MDV6309975.1 glycosyltransferase [Gordonia amicalis]